MNRRMIAAVRLFWKRYGFPPSRPCNLEQIASLALPVTTVGIPNLSVASANQWLSSRSVPVVLHSTQRPLRGALVAFAGQGIIFFDASDCDEDRRYTIAHEIAHFLDYWSIRRELIDRFGYSFGEVLDGFRPPSQKEQIQALLDQIPIGVWTDLMSRSGSGGCSPRVEASEKIADEIALMLLAPGSEVIKKARLKRIESFGARRDRVRELLQHHFGIPASIAQSYAPLLLSRTGAGYSWVEDIRRATR